MRNFKDIKHKRFIFYFLAFLIGFAPFLPIPFAPEFLKDIITRLGGLFYIPIFLLLFIWATVFMTDIIFNKKFEAKFLVEAIGVPLLFLHSIHLLFPVFTEMRYNFIVSFNDRSKIENFVNPFLGMKMLDCRQTTEDFEVMFIPDHFDIETDILIYSSQGKSVNGFRVERTFNTRWHLVGTGSMWGDTFRNCLMQNKNPNS